VTDTEPQLLRLDIWRLLKCQSSQGGLIDSDDFDRLGREQICVCSYTAALRKIGFTMASMSEHAFDDSRCRRASLRGWWGLSCGCCSSCSIARASTAFSPQNLQRKDRVFRGWEVPCLPGLVSHAVGTDARNTTI
jgi:hypothetical protein